MASLKTAQTFTTATKVALPAVGGSLQVPPQCIGTWSWGDSAWNYDEKKDLPLIRDTWKHINTAGLGFYDTAEVYGMGESEKIIGKLLAEAPSSDVIIATKWLPVPVLPNRLWPRGVVSCLKLSLFRLGIDKCDLYQVHGRVHFLTSIESVAKGLADCVKQGLTKAVGVSNYSKEHMIRMYEALKKEGIPLASNQIEYSLLRRNPEYNGLIEACHERGIVPLAYSPIGQGRLSGKYSVDNPPPSNRRFGNFSMDKIQPLLDVMKVIAEKHDVPMTAVALNWIMCKGAIPLPGARNAQQAEQNAKCLGWRLSEEEITELEAHSFEGGNNTWQQG